MTEEQRRFGYFVPKPGGIMDISVTGGPLPAEVLAEFDRITQVVHLLQPILLAWEMVDRNYGELTSSVSSFQAEVHALKFGHGSPMPVLMNGLALISQRVSNFLSAASAFLGQTETTISRARGEDSNELTTWNTLRNELHARNFAYRFLYELRNFGQHFSIPLSTLYMQGARPSPDADLVFHAQPRMVRDTLLTAGYKWKPALRAELEGQPAKVDLVPLCDEYYRLLRALALCAVSLEEARLADCTRYFQVIAAKFQYPAGAMPVIVYDAQPGVPPSQYGLIPFEQLAWVLDHRQRLQGTFTNTTCR